MGPITCMGTADPFTHWCKVWTRSKCFNIPSRFPKGWEISE